MARPLGVYLPGVSTLLPLVTVLYFHFGVSFIDYPTQTRNVVPRIGFAFDWSPYFKAVPEIQQDNGPRLKQHRAMERNRMGYTARASMSGPLLVGLQIFCSDRITLSGFKVLTSLAMSIDLLAA
jgi:hypothetical protein